MFVCVRYGNDNTIILNIDCGLQVFKDCLRRKCNLIETNMAIDLADEFGNVQFLSSKDPRQRVCTILEERLSYVLVELKMEESETIVQPLLNNWIPKSETSDEIIRERSTTSRMHRGKSKK